MDFFFSVATVVFPLVRGAGLIAKVASSAAAKAAKVATAKQPFDVWSTLKDATLYGILRRWQIEPHQGSSKVTMRYILLCPAVLLAFATACGGASSPEVTKPPSEVTEPPSPQPNVTKPVGAVRWSIKVVTPTSSSRLHVDSVGLVIERDGARRVWRGYTVNTRFGHRGGGAGRSVECSRDVAAPEKAVADLERRMSEVSITDHERKGGGGSATVVIIRAGVKTRTQLECDLTTTAPTTDKSLCSLAQAVVGLYKAQACSDPEASPACEIAFSVAHKAIITPISHAEATKAEKKRERQRQKRLQNDECKI